MNADADDKVCVAGSLTFSTVSAQLAASAVLFKDRSRLCFDLSGVTAVDSSALALLVEWLRIGRQHGILVQFSQVPPALRSLATVSELDQIDAALAMS
jgi:phospholipid transport system transporter-binding protein